MATLRGSIHTRPNGRHTVVTEPTWDPKAGKHRRPSLGTYDTRDEAEVVLLEYNHATSIGVFALSEVELRRTRLDRYLTEWLDLVRREHEAGDIELRTLRDYESVTRGHLLPQLGDRRIGDLTSQVLHRWLLDLKAAGLSDRTVQKAWRTLHRAFADSELKENPARLPKRLRPSIKRRKAAVYPTVDEIRQFLDHVAECDSAFVARTAALWRLAASCGLRRGELAGLAWPDADVEAASITIRQTIQVDGHTPFVKGPKSYNGYRTIGLDGVTARQLRRHRTRMLEERARAGASYDHQPLGLDLVFRADPHGAPINPNRLTATFTREWTHAALPKGPTLHGLRHTNGSALILAGIAITQVAAHLGDDVQTLVKVYAHELDSPERQRAVAGAVAQLYG